VHKRLYNQAPDYLSELSTPAPKSPNDSTLFGQPLPTRRANNTARYVPLSRFRCGCSDRLERTWQRSALSRSQRCQLRSPTEDASVSAVLGAPSALEALCYNALYKLTLTYSALLHSAYSAFDALNTAETEASSVGDQSWRC